jgi:hypothetical protein
MPPEAYTYALPLELAARHRIRRYGRPADAAAARTGRRCWIHCSYLLRLPPPLLHFLALQQGAERFHATTHCIESAAAAAGFHGISYSYLTHEAARMMDTPKQQLNLIICHLGVCPQSMPLPLAPSSFQPSACCCWRAVDTEQGDLC